MKRIICTVYALICALQSQAQITFNDSAYVLEQNLRIPLKDGTVLSGWRYSHKRYSLPLPVILRVNCYPMPDDADKLRGKMLADSGYIFMTVYPRGKATSEGTFEPFENDARDNYDIIDWISRQPWCNGKIGMFGGSYLGFAQWAAVKKVHPALKTIVPQVAVGPGIDYPNPGGIFLTFALRWIKYVKNGPYSDRNGFANTAGWNSLYEQYYRSGIPFNRLDSLEGAGTDRIFQRWLQHPANDTFWQSMTPTPAEYAAISIPILTTTGYFDDDQRGAMHYYNMHHRYGNPDAVKRHYLYIGPFDHAGGQGGRIMDTIGPYLIPDNAKAPQNQMVLQWFDHVLKGGPLPVMLKDRVNLYVMGENAWRHFPSVQAMNSDTMVLYLSSGRLLPAPAGGKSASATMILNPQFEEEDTLPVFSDNSSLVENALFRNKEILVFKTDVLEKSIALNGSVTAQLFISASQPDADLLLSWWEEDRNGRCWPLSRTQQRLSHTVDPSQRHPLKKNRIYSIPLNDAAWMSKRLEAGSKLLLCISSAANMYFEKNYHGAGPVAGQNAAEAAPVELKVHTSRKYPSSISLPVLQMEEANNE